MQKVTIDRLGHQGDGIAEGPIYAPRTLPGEVVSGALDGNTLRDVRIHAPSPARVTPPCRHFSTCGGCQLQHASDDFVADWKEQVVRTALAAHGIEAPFRPMAISPPNSRRRATLAARRTKKGAMAGFHRRGSDQIVEIPDCQLLHPDLMAALPVAEDAARCGASRKHALAVSATTSRNGLDIAVSDGKELDGPLRQELAQLAQRYDLARIAWNGETIATRLAPEQDFDGVTVVPPPGAFLQATAEGEAALRADVTAALATARRVVDLFAGCGTFALPLARGARVDAAEGAPGMVAALDHAWRHATGLKSLTAGTRDLFRRPLMAEELAGYDGAVIDPPRAGASAQVAEIVRAGLPVIAYVSCHPASFARDARDLLVAGYHLAGVRVVDQFRWSAHVELVAEFRRDA